MKVEDLLCDKSKWTRGSFAKDISGENVTNNDPNAVCWCVFGAILKVYSNEVDLENAILKLSDTVGGGIVNFNDTHSYEEVITDVRKAGI